MDTGRSAARVVNGERTLEGAGFSATGHS